VHCSIAVGVHGTRADGVHGTRVKYVTSSVINSNVTECHSN
jgi:hypothetical protein